MEDTSKYDLESTQLPYLSGTVLKLFVKLLKTPVIGNLLIANLLKTAGIDAFRKKIFDEEITGKPLYFSKENNVQSKPESGFSEPDSSPPQGFHFLGASDFVQAYQSGQQTPESVAQRVIDVLKDSDQRNPPLRAVIAYDVEDIMEQARASAERYQKGTPLSLLDGVPIAVKDEMDMVPYPTTVGTAFLGKEPAKEDSTVAARLREKGALLIGKANMHEIGINVTGLNPHHGIARNPYSLQRYTGGSSSGPASAVAAGLCPIAIGADGGGSIRIPASFCGVVGIKSTYGRVSEFGAAPLCWSVAHIGPITANVRDLVLAWSLIAGPDEKDPNTLVQPPLNLENWTNLDLSDLSIGVYWPWFRHAAPAVVESCEQMVKYFEDRGAKIVSIEIPDLEAGRIAHLITIASEMAQAMDPYWAEHGNQFGLDVQTNLILARNFTSRDYIQAQRVRTRLIGHFMSAFEDVDVILTPATGLTAPEIKPNALPDGDSDLTVLNEIMRFAQPANMTGLPAIAFPVGYDQGGMPISMQAMGKPWDERTLFRLALAAEGVVERRKPIWHYSLLEN